MLGMDKARVLAMVLTVMGLVACETTPTGRRQLQFFPDTQMAQMGITAYQQIKQQTPTSKDTSVKGYVACVAHAITDVVDQDQAREWEVTVFKDDAANAFALPGGKIGVYTGLLDVAESQAQLATVIGHEVAHVLAEHGNARLSTAFATEAGLQLAQVLAGGASQEKQQIFALLGLGTQVGVLLPFSRSQETEADILGLDLMAKAGFNPRESVELWRNMDKAGGAQPPQFLSTHPAGTTRIDNLNAHMGEALTLYEQARQSGRRPDCR